PYRFHGTYRSYESLWNSRQLNGGAKAEIAVAEGRRVGITARTAHVGGDVAPTAAAHREATLRIAVHGVAHRLLRERPVARRTELPHVAQHVVQPEGVGPITADRRQERVAVVHRH